jgi:NAD(P)-dependent dehydrogenase (short-subunit alcohol dehydrogenase family)
MLVSESTLAQDSLKDQVVIITGAGRGIGYEAARALLWLGANVVIAEVDEETGKSAAENLEREFGRDKALFVKTDVGSDKDVENLAKEVLGKWGKVDIVLNNAPVFPMGEVKDTPVDKWDFRYHVNLRGPVLLAKGVSSRNDKEKTWGFCLRVFFRCSTSLKEKNNNTCF